MAPPTKKRKAKASTIRKEDWTPFQPRIVELYSVEKRKLSEIQETMKQEFGKYFTPRQLRSLLSGLGHDKNIKKPEYQAIVRKNQRRKLIEREKGRLAFRVRGVIVEPANVERWMKRHAVKENQLYSPSPSVATPAAFSAWTISERGSPTPSPTTLIDSPNVPMARLLAGSRSPRLPTDLPVDSVAHSTQQSIWDAEFDNALHDLPVDSAAQSTQQSIWDAEFDSTLHDMSTRSQFQMDPIDLPSFGNDNPVQYTQVDERLPNTESLDGTTVRAKEGPRLKNPRHQSSAEWEVHKDEISRLYRTLPLHSKAERKETVMSVMKREHNFIATLKQYKDRISMWGLDNKNMKTNVMEAIVRKRQKRKIGLGKNSQFQYNGKNVDETKVIRFMKRKKIPLASMDVPFTPCPTPPEISVFTPEPMEAWAPSPLDDRAMAYKSSIQYSDIPSPLLSICRSSKAPYNPLSTALVRSAATDITSVDFTKWIDWERFKMGLETVWNHEHDQNRYCSPNERQIITGLMTVDWHQGETVDVLRVEKLRSLGLIYYDQGRFQLAEMVQLRSALILCKHRGESDRAYMAVLNDMLDNLVAQGRFIEALRLGKYIWHIRLADSGRDHSTLELATMNNLAFSYLQLRNNDEAHSLLLEVLDWRRFMGDKSTPILRAMSYLGNLFRRRGHFEEAANLKHCVLEVKVELFGECSFETTPSRANLARVYLEQGLLDKAEDTYLKNWKILKEILPDEHVDVAYCLYCLAKVSVARRKWLAVLDYASRASDIYRVVVGEEHAWTLVCRGYMMDGYRGLGWLDQARELGDATLSKAQKYLGQDHDTTLRIKMSLALTYAEQGRLLENESLQVELIEAVPRVYDDNPLI